MQLFIKVITVLLSLQLVACSLFHERYTDEEAVAAILNADGSGSGLDADLLDGKDSSEFVLATEDRWVDEVGDTMTGPLNIESTVTAEKYLYDSPKRGHFGIAGASFIPNVTNGTAWVSNENGYGYLKAHTWVPSQGVKLCNNDCYVRVTALSGDVELRANIVVPETSKITNFSCFWYDSSHAPLANYTFKLMKKKWYEVAAQTMATVSGSTNDYASADAIRVATTDSITDSVIDTLRNSYFISGRWHAMEGLGDKVRFYGCLIDYEISQLGLH